VTIRVEAFDNFETLLNDWRTHLRARNRSNLEYVCRRLGGLVRVELRVEEIDSGR
jgi:hypothetical protein